MSASGMMTASCWLRPAAPSRVGRIRMPDPTMSRPLPLGRGRLDQGQHHPPRPRRHSQGARVPRGPCHRRSGRDDPLVDRRVPRQPLFFATICSRDMPMPRCTSSPASWTQEQLAEMPQSITGHPSSSPRARSSAAAGARCRCAWFVPNTPQGSRPIASGSRTRRTRSEGW